MKHPASVNHITSSGLGDLDSRFILWLNNQEGLCLGFSLMSPRRFAARG